MYDAQCQMIMGNEAPPAGTRLDKRIERPDEQYYTSQRRESDAEKGCSDRGMVERTYRDPFLPRHAISRMPVPTAANHERPRKKKYK